MRQKCNETVLLIWSAPHGPFIGSTQSANGSPALEAIEFSEEYKWIHDLH